MRQWIVLVGMLLSGVVAAQTLKLVTGNDYAPFSDETLPNRGMATELVELVVQEMGHASDIRFLPWKRGYAATIRGEFVATFPYIRTAEREQDYLFSDPLNHVATRVFVAHDSTLRYQTVQDLVGKTACNTLGSSHPKSLEKLMLEGKVARQSPRDLSSCFGMLRLGRVDFVAINDLTGWGVIRKTYGSHEGFKAIGPPVEMVGQHLMVPRGNPLAEKFLATFNQAMASLEKRGLLKEVRDRHLKAFLERP